MTAAEFLNSWTLQAGFPVVDVHFTGDTARLKQKRFIIGISEDVTDNSTWIIPINWATSSYPNFNDTRKVNWLTKNQSSITIRNANKDWVIFNIQQTGTIYNIRWKRSISYRAKQRSFKV